MANEELREKLTKVETSETQNLKAWYPKQNQNLNKIQITISTTLIYLKKIGKIIYLLEISSKIQIMQYKILIL